MHGCKCNVAFFLRLGAVGMWNEDCNTEEHEAAQMLGYCRSKVHSQKSRCEMDIKANQKINSVLSDVSKSQ